MKDEQTYEGLLDSRGDGLSGVLGLTDSHSDQFGTHVRKEGENKSYESEKTADQSMPHRFSKPLRDLPLTNPRNLPTSPGLL